MKEKLYTIPLNDAVNASDECPFCFIERELEQNSLDFVLGNSSSYMESDIRDQTDKAGFCRVHMKKMFDYGNTLGNALILQTHYHKLREEMRKQFDSFSPGKSSVLARFRRSDSSADKNPLHGLRLRIAAVLSVRILRIHLNGMWKLFSGCIGRIMNLKIKFCAVKASVCITSGFCATVQINI